MKQLTNNKLQFINKLVNLFDIGNKKLTEKELFSIAKEFSITDKILVKELQELALLRDAFNTINFKERFNRVDDREKKLYNYFEKYFNFIIDILAFIPYYYYYHYYKNRSLDYS